MVIIKGDGKKKLRYRLIKMMTAARDELERHNEVIDNFVVRQYSDEHLYFMGEEMRKCLHSKENLPLLQKYILTDEELFDGFMEEIRTALKKSTDYAHGDGIIFQTCIQVVARKKDNIVLYTAEHLVIGNKTIGVQYKGVVYNVTIGTRVKTGPFRMYTQSGVDKVKRDIEIMKNIIARLDKAKSPKVMHGITTEIVLSDEELSVINSNSNRFYEED